MIRVSNPPALNQRVVGSNPTAPTNKSKDFKPYTPSLLPL